MIRISSLVGNQDLKAILAITVIFLFTVPSSHSQVTTLNNKHLNKATIENFFTEQSAKYHLPGVSIAFINNARISYQGEFGYADLESKKKANENSMYEACSMSKPVFAYFILKMAEKGVLSIDSPLYKYLPYPDIEYDNRYKLITARMVLSHTTGLPNWHEYEPADTSLHLPKGAQYLKFTPGTAYNYSGEGYQYLVAVITHLLKTDSLHLKDIVNRQVCKPLNMKHAVYGWNQYVAKHKVTGYRQTNDDGINKQGVLKKFEAFSAAGGLHTNALDYANFVIALMKKKGLSKASFKEMFTPQVKVPDSDEADDWGLGLAIKKTKYGTRFMHSGNNGDFTCYFVMYENSNSGFVFLTNCNRAGDLFDNLLPLFEKGTHH